jgi:hypothetical protein
MKIPWDNVVPKLALSKEQTLANAGFSVWDCVKSPHAVFNFNLWSEKQYFVFEAAILFFSREKKNYGLTAHLECYMVSLPRLKELVHAVCLPLATCYIVLSICNLSQSRYHYITIRYQHVLVGTRGKKWSLAIGERRLEASPLER